MKIVQLTEQEFEKIQNAYRECWIQVKTLDNIYRDDARGHYIKMDGLNEEQLFSIRETIGEYKIVEA